MVSVKNIVEGLELQFDAAIAGEADPAQANIVCKTVDSIIKLARLQIEMGGIDWTSSSEAPVIEMEPSVPVVKKISEKSQEVKTPPFNQEREKPEKLNHPVTAKTSQGQDIERQIFLMRSKLNLSTTTDKEKATLTDRIELQRNKLKRLEPDWKG